MPYLLQVIKFCDIRQNFTTNRNREKDGEFPPFTYYNKKGTPSSPSVQRGSRRMQKSLPEHCCPGRLPLKDGSYLPSRLVGERHTIGKAQMEKTFAAITMEQEN